MVNAEVVATGSTGNFSVLEKKVSIDAGVSYKIVEPYMDGLKLCLLTHIHSDHFRPSTVRRMAMEKPLLRFGCCAWMVKPLVESGVAKSQIDVLKPNYLYSYGICNVIPVELFHDVPNVGYKIHFPTGKVFYATDTGSLSGINARNYDLLMVESNYIDEEIKARMDEKCARGEYCYEQRSLKYHLSKAKCDDFIVKNSGPNTQFIYLHCHVDRENDRRKSEPLTEWEHDES